MTYLEKTQVWKNVKNLDSSLKKELEQMSDDELKEAFGADLEFGTAGLRGILGAGTNRMNIYLVRKATLGFGRYLAQFDNAFTRGVCIAHDNRRMSREFALDSSHVLTKMGFHVYLFEDLRPTPELSFAVRANHSIGGIMITASHNPKEYNGYKVYNEEGCQLLPEEVSDVIHEINEVTDMFNVPLSEDNYGITFMGKEMDDLFISNDISVVKNKNYKKDFKITYTPLHGTGQVFIPQVLQSLGYDVTPVAEQMTNDPEFSAVKTSNPENKSAFDEAIMLADKIGAKVVLATDPDADRLGVGCIHNGKWELLTGNQSATLIFDYLIKMAHKENKDLSNSYMFSTIVSSSLPVEIAKKANMKYKLSLTGFKYVGDNAKKIEGKSEYFFGYEESYGCLVKDTVRDKDSLQACVLLCEVAAYYYEQGKDMVDALEDIYKEYGFYKDSISNIVLEGLEGKKKINSAMDYFKTHDIKLNSFNIINKLNVADSTETNLVTGETVASDLPKSNVVKYDLEGGSWFVLRPSGTEPKLKVYYQIVASNSDEADEKMALLQKEVLDIVMPLTK